MKPDAPLRLSRRRWLAQSATAALAAAMAGRVAGAFAADQPPGFAPAGNEFTFDTGELRGTLRSGGQSRGLSPVFDVATGAALAQPFGLFSHYRVLDATKRYGTAAWDRASEARRSSDGAVEVRWPADDANPFELTAEYRWRDAHTLDLTTRATARAELPCFEVFLASYFAGFPRTFVYAGVPAAFQSVPKEAGVWQMFPRDAAAVKTLQDGRWKHPPSPVEWSQRPMLAAPLAVRRDPERGLAAVLMTRTGDCFAVAAPHDEERHRSIYFSLFGRDLKSGESAEAKSRLWMGRDRTEPEVLDLYQRFQKETTNS